MSMRLFYAEHIVGDVFTFDDSESRHIVKVLRLKNADKLLITDGKGYFYESEIIGAHHKRCQIRILKKTLQKKHDYYLHIAIAPTKNIERLEWFLEKTTEIGIDEITPILCDNSERKVIKHERLRKVIESAMKQSYKAYHPKLNDLTPLSQFLEQEHPQEFKWMAHCYDSPKQNIREKLQPKASVLIMIGPEGDFSIEELEKANALGIQPLSLGDYRLRTETAGVVACNYVSFIN